MFNAAIRKALTRQLLVAIVGLSTLPAYAQASSINTSDKLSSEQAISLSPAFSTSVGDQP